MSVPPPLFDQPPPARRKLMASRDRIFSLHSGTLLFLRPFGFIVGPLLPGEEHVRWDASTR